jgi:hypothetical protein
LEGGDDDLNVREAMVIYEDTRWIVDVYMSSADEDMQVRHEKQVDKSENGIDLRFSRWHVMEADGGLIWIY